MKSKKTAELLTEQLPQVEINNLTMVSGANDGHGFGSDQHFSSKNEDRLTTQEVPLVEPADVMALPKGQAFALVNGAQLYKLRMPLMGPETDIAVPKSVLAAAKEMRQQYATSEAWWKEAA